jgi:pimeloyl-ACP methyl ester carboxylesterase
MHHMGRVATFLADVPLLTSRRVRSAPPAAVTSGSWRSRHRRRTILAGAAVPVFLIAVLAAVSWHFSSAVVVPDHSARPADATVDALRPDQVVLSRSADSLRPGMYGLDWRAGHAIVEGVASSGVHTVTRRLRAVSGRLTPGTRVALDSSVYEGDPERTLGMRFSSVPVPDELGPMPAWLIPGRTHTWAIVVHGINGNRENNLRIAPALHRAGLPVLLITYRGDVGAPGGPDGLHHMGLTEWRDLEAAARYSFARGARRLVLIGYSMGGAIVTQFMERSPLASRVVGLVLDAPALSWKPILSFNAKEEGFPSFAAVPLEWMIGLRIDANWESLDALKHTASFHLPILLFHGTEDKTVPISLSDGFARELSRWVTYYRVPSAGHVESWNVDSTLYDQRLIAFLARIGA